MGDRQILGSGKNPPRLHSAWMKSQCFMVFSCPICLIILVFVFMFLWCFPIGSMYGIYANIGGILMVNVTIYSIHGSYGFYGTINDSIFGFLSRLSPCWGTPDPLGISSTSTPPTGPFRWRRLSWESPSRSEQWSWSWMNPPNPWRIHGAGRKMLT